MTAKPTLSDRAVREDTVLQVLNRELIPIVKRLRDGSNPLDGVRFVSAGFAGASDGGIGSPYPTIQKALDAITETSAGIIVGPGDYSSEVLTMNRTEASTFFLQSILAPDIFGVIPLWNVTSITCSNVTPFISGMSCAGAITSDGTTSVSLTSSTVSGPISGMFAVLGSNATFLSTVSCQIVFADGCTFSQNITLDDGGVIGLTRCAFSSGFFPATITVTFIGTPGVLSLDEPTWYAWQASGSSVVNGTVSVSFAYTNVGTVTGSRGGNAALASLLTTLATAGIITDGTTA